MAIGALIDRLRKRGDANTAPVMMDEPEHFGGEPLRVLISPLNGDIENRAARHIHDRLAGRLGLTVRITERPLTAPGAENSEPVFLSMAVDLGRRWLRRENADLLIWGDAVRAASLTKDQAPGQSWRLRFLSLSTPVQPLGATLSALERLEVPAFFGTDVSDLVFGAALAAVNVETQEGIRARASLFGATLKRAKHFAEGDMLGTVAQCATMQACYAALLLLDGARTGDTLTLEKAVSVYRGAIILGDDAFTAHEKAMIGAHMADAMSLIADATDHARLADKTVEYYRTALTMVRKDIFADDYAALKTRLGLALNIMAEIHKDARYLDEATEAFNQATSIWTISEAPERWADIQNSLGGLLITMGKLMKQPTLFDKAVGVFIKIAEVMNRKKAPVVWATTLANIGSALKEKGEAVQSQDYLKQAVVAFNQAEQVFSELHMEGNARVVGTQRAAVMQALEATI